MLCNKPINVEQILHHSTIVYNFFHLLRLKKVVASHAYHKYCVLHQLNLGFNETPKGKEWEREREHNLEKIILNQ